MQGRAAWTGIFLQLSPIRAHAAVAQPAEQLSCNQQVEGSNPSGGSSSTEQNVQKVGGEMPNRLIKESVCTSDNLDRLSWFEEAMFFRLIVNCDDFGRMDARPAILRSRLFPLKTVTDTQIEKALQSLRSADMIDIYVVDGRSFLQMRTWEKHQQVRAKKSKYPAPDNSMIASDINCKQMISNVPVIQSESESNAVVARASAATASFEYDEDDLTEQIANVNRASGLIRRYRLTDSDATLEALLEDAESVGFDALETALKTASQSDTRGGISVNFYRAILRGEGGKKKQEEYDPYAGVPVYGSYGSG